MKKNTWLVLVLAIIFSLASLAGCSSGTGAPAASGDAAKTIELRLSHPWSPDHPWQKGAEKFVELMKEQVGDQIKIDIYPNASLSENNERTMTEQAMLGTLDIVITPSSLIDKKFGVFGYPFVFETPEQVYAMLENPIMLALLDTSEANGLKGLCYWENGFRQLTNSVRPVKSPKDMVGLKIRVPQSQDRLATLKALGANPVSIALGELYVGLSQGTADGQENPLTTIYNEKFYEVQDYCTVFNYIWSAATFGVNTGVWNSLPPNVQEAMTKAAKEAGAYTSELIAQGDQNLIQELTKLGMQVYVPTKEELAEFKAAAQTDELYQICTGIFGEDLLKSFLAEVEKL